MRIQHLDEYGRPIEGDLMGGPDPHHKGPYLAFVSEDEAAPVAIPAEPAADPVDSYDALMARRSAIIGRLLQANMSGTMMTATAIRSLETADRQTLVKELGNVHLACCDLLKAIHDLYGVDADLPYMTTDGDFIGLFRAKH